MCVPLLVFLFSVLNFDRIVQSEDIYMFPYKSVEQCKKNERYDLDTFQCVECDGKTQLLVPSLDRTTCICQPNTVEEALYDTVTRQPVCSNSTNCKSCTPLQGPRCKIKYIDSVNLNRTTSNSNRIRIFHDDSTNCTCDIKINYRYKDYCISMELLKNYHHYSTFQPDRRIYAELKFIAFFCKALRNTTACNHLANLCIASFYSLAKNSPCSMFYVAQATDAGVYNEQDDSEDVRPFVFYRKVKATQMELAKAIDYSYELKSEAGERGSLRLITSIQSLDGTLIRFANFSPSSINLCSRYKLSDYDSFKFGENYETNCKFTLDHLLEIADTNDHFYYSVYLNYTIDKVQYLQPVPILIRNCFKFNELANPSDWQLVKRFQIFDSHKLSSSSAQQQSRRLPFYDDSSRLEHFKMIRYISNVQLNVKINNENRISTPLIILRYKTIHIHRNTSLKSQYAHRFAVNYRIDQNLNFTFEILLPLTMAVGLAFALLRTYNFRTRQNKEYYDFAAICEFILYLCNNCANALFVVVVFICLYVFFVCTGQIVIKMLVPIEQQSLIDALICVAFGLKIIYLTFFFSRIIHSDIFFIDWERPRGSDGLSTQRSNLDTPSVCSSVRSSTTGEAVSAWRNFFVANEWIRISHRRRTSMLFQNITVLICLEFTSFRLNPTNDKTLNLSLIILTQFLLYAIQICTNRLLLERIYGNPLHQFVDICSTANISVFLLLHDSYGFYIHGRSPHGFSDVDMSSIILQLQREAQNICGRRGLLTGSDNQTYVMLVPTDLRMYYNKLLTPFQKVACISQTHYEKEICQNKTADYTLEKTSTAYSNINRFFCAFIDHSIKDLDYIIKEKTVIESLFDCEFESYLSETKGTFYIDSRQSFAHMLLYGNDAQIFLCSLLLFCSIFVITKSLIVSAFITSVLDQIFQMLFRRLVKCNVARKTLIDKRFLI